MEVRSYDLRCIRVEEKLALLYRNCGRAWVRAICIHVSAKEEWKACNTSNVFINNFRSNDRATRTDVKLILLRGEEMFIRCYMYCFIKMSLRIYVNMKRKES